MSLAVLHSRAFVGTEALRVRVEVHLAAGLPSFTLVGLPDTEVRESRERVRSALVNSGFEFPSRRITVNLAPADLPKGSGRFDLPIALGIAAASGQLPNAALDDWEFAGELSLSGQLLPCTGGLAMAVAMLRDEALPSVARRRRSLLLPEANAAGAARVPGISVYGAQSLFEASAHLVGHGAPLSRHSPSDTNEPATGSGLLDMRDVRGQSAAKRGLEIAAAGQHNLLMIGPPGSGKSMLAARLPGILPPMDPDHALDSAAIASLRGDTAIVLGQRPFRAPHHSCSTAALVGGGKPPKPGEITLAHHGVLFMDEILEFDRRSLEALREPLETGEVHVSRVGHQIRFPARFQWVVAHNPCPCGWLGHPVQICRCTPEQVARYRSRLSGPLLDRIDLGMHVGTVEHQTMLAAADGDGSGAIAARTGAAHALQLRRQGVTNAELSGDALLHWCQPEPAGEALLLTASRRLAWSGRSVHRTLRVARTIADLSGAQTITQGHIAEAIQFRKQLQVSV
jgi:magnesium chelatase family protein